MMNSFSSCSSLIEPYDASPTSPPNLFCEETYQNAVFDKLWKFGKPSIKWVMVIKFTICYE